MPEVVARAAVQAVRAGAAVEPVAASEAEECVRAPEPVEPVRTAVAAQEPQEPQEPPPVTFRVEVNYVEVDAIVTDANGNPITDLTAKDFQVTEDGRPQTIS